MLGSQPPHLYGLAKVHKVDVPLKHVVKRTITSAYTYRNDCQSWKNLELIRLQKVLSKIQLDADEEISFTHVAVLYTNVPVRKAINDCTRLLILKNINSLL